MFISEWSVLNTLVNVSENVDVVIFMSIIITSGMAFQKKLSYDIYEAFCTKPAKLCVNLYTAVLLRIRILLDPDLDHVRSGSPDSKLGECTWEEWQKDNIQY